jgi:hypothetical protein
MEECCVQIDSEHEQCWVIGVALETFLVIMFKDHSEEIEDGLLVLHDGLVSFKSFVELTVLTVGKGSNIFYVGRHSIA